ncbi:MAG: hypothetical protein ACOYU0_01400 [Nitrospirota bacterium]
MTPNEVKVLNVVEEMGKISKRRVAGLLGISTEYAGYLLERLGNGGYLAVVDRGVYTLLAKGIEALLGQLYFAKSKLEANIARLSMEKERIGKEIERLSALQKESISA